MKRLAVLLAVVSVSLASCGSTSKRSEMPTGNAGAFAAGFYEGAASVLLILADHQEPSIASIDSSLSTALDAAGASPVDIEAILSVSREMRGVELTGPR